MEKKIQDYLHYYIGWSGYADGVYGYITSVDEFGGSEFKLHGEASVIYMDGALIRPILRKIENITEDECKEYNNISSTMYSINQSQDQIKTSATETHFLLSKGFDLFDLIFHGLAIDAATLPK